MSNVLGTITPVRHIADAAHAAGALVLVDAAQYVPHLATDVDDLGCDFLGLTGHKMLGPTGVGALWAREELLEAMPAFLGGGEMITDVRLDGWTPNEIPWKFEAGTPPIAEIIGLGAAVDYLEALGMDAVREHEVALTTYALRTLHDRFGDRIEVHGPADPADRGGVLSLALADVHPHDVSQVLDQTARLRPGRPPLRQAAHASPGRGRHRPGVPVRLQRRIRRRRARRCARRRRRLLRPVRR